jgi:predicted metal-dependent peptidase
MRLIYDTSGSIDADLAGQFFAEIDILAKSAKITVIQCDAEVQDVREWKNGYKCEIHGRGGTLYQPALDAASKLDIDGLIYFGDMECFDKDLKKPKYPILWAKTKGAKKPADWGSETEVEVVKK